MTPVQPFQCVSGATYPCKTPPTARKISSVSAVPQFARLGGGWRSLELSGLWVYGQLWAVSKKGRVSSRSSTLHRPTSNSKYYLHHTLIRLEADLALEFPCCLVRHQVRPIAALQRRAGFSTRLAGFCRIKWHQRRARRAEKASFSVLVSNRYFRVPRLRPNRRTGADRAVPRRKRGRPRVLSTDTPGRRHFS